MIDSLQARHSERERERYVKHPWKNSRKSHTDRKAKTNSNKSISFCQDLKEIRDKARQQNVRVQNSNQLLHLRKVPTLPGKQIEKLKPCRKKESISTEPYKLLRLKLLMHSALSTSNKEWWKYQREQKNISSLISHFYHSWHICFRLAEVTKETKRTIFHL